MIQVDQIWSNSTLTAGSAHFYPELICEALCRVMNKDDIYLVIVIMLKHSGQGRARVGPGYQRPVMSSPTIASCSPTLEIVDVGKIFIICIV